MEWKTSSVSLIFKKGDPADCDNYRPISLITVAEKLFASMIKQRMIDAGADAVLWPSQFGFRPGCSTEDAIYIARRRIELARAQRHGRVTLVALDWAKAFDSINTASLLDALRRYGIPQPMLDMISGLFQDRSFYVRDCGGCSEPRPQNSGISQGCTLSPMLFVMVMSVLLHDAVASLGDDAKCAYEKGDLNDVVYADDTLLMGGSDKFVTEYLHAVAAAGKKYGMDLHWGKFQVLPIQCSPVISAENGVALPLKTRMEYLGTILSGDVHDAQELNRRIGMARADFLALSRAWKHSGLSQRRKLILYSSLVEAKLLYALSTLIFTMSSKRQLNGFQNRCLRTIVRIKPSYISRVSNAAVLRKSGHRLATDLLQNQQIQLLGRVIRAPEGHPLRTASFIPGTNWPATERYVRRVGRPSAEWVPEMMRIAEDRLGSTRAVVSAAMNKQTWSAAFDLVRKTTQ